MQKFNFKNNIMNSGLVLAGLFIAVTLLFVADRLINSFPGIIGRAVAIDLRNADSWQLDPKFEPFTFKTSDYDENVIRSLAKKGREQNAKITTLERGKEIPGVVVEMVPGKVFAQHYEAFSGNGEPTYSVDYHFDSGLRRITKTSTEQIGDTAVLILGCSLTYGEGVADEETYPYLFSQSAKKVSTYNLGRRGSAANDLLKKMDDDSNFFKVPAEKIIIVYGFDFDHLDREFCPYDCYFNSNWKVKLPRYKIDGDELSYTGTHEDYYNNSYLFSLARHFKSITVGPLLFPSVYSDDAVKLHLRLLHEIKNKFAKHYQVIDTYQLYLNQNKNTVVGLMESLNNPPEFKPIITPNPRYKEELKIGNMDGIIMGNGHPNAMADYVIGKTLTMRLQKDHPELF